VAERAHWLAFLAWLVGALLGVGDARAEGTVSSQNASYSRYFMCNGSTSACVGQYATPAATCAAWAAHANTVNGVSAYSCSGTGGSGFDQAGAAVNTSMTVLDSRYGTTFNSTAVAYNILNAAGCPANSTLAANGQCTCNANYAPNAGATACVAVASSSCQTLVDAANALGIDGTFTANSAPGSTQFCSGGCYINAMGGTFYKDGSGTWKGQFYGPFTLTSTTCPGGAPAAGSAAPAPCPAGQAPGSVNGVTSCYPAGTTTTTSSKTTSSGSGAPTGSETSTTTCTGSSCTTTTTTRDASGAVTGTVTESEPRERFCEENPETTICKSSTATVSCSAGAATVACDGDAVQCAMLQDQYQRHCQLFDATGSVKDAGADALARGDTRASDHPREGANVLQVGSGTSGIDQTDLLGGGSCPADQVVPVYGANTVTIAWSKVCTPASWLGNLLVAFTLVAWVFIAFKTG